MNSTYLKGPNGLTPREALDTVPDDVGEAARDTIAAERYGADYGDFVTALGDQIEAEEARCD